MLRDYLPFGGSRKKKIVLEPLTVNPHLFYMEWTRGPIPKAQGAESYWLSSQQLPMYSLSGPNPTNARRIELSRPAPAQMTRQIPDAQVGQAGTVNGQVFSQPLYDAVMGGFGRTLFPSNAFPTTDDTIAPAGVA